MSLRKSFAWTFSQQFWLFGVNFFGSVVVARLLTPEEMGIFGLAVAAYGLMSSLRDFGVGSYLIQQASLNEDMVRTAFGIWIVVSWTFGLVILAFRNGVADLYHTPGIASVLTLVSISLFITPLGQPANALLNREMRFDILHHIAVISTIVTIATNIVLAVAGWGYMALAWGMVSGTVINSALLIAVRPSHLRMLPSFKYWREVLNFGGWMTGTSILGTIKNEGYRLILGGFINPAAVGLFERAIQIPNQANRALFGPVWSVLFPSFSKDIREGASIAPALEKLVAITTAITWPFLLGTAFVAQPTIVFLFGEQWRVAGQLLPYFLLAQALVTSLPPPYQILVPHGQVRRYFWVCVFTTASGLVLAVIGAMWSLRWFAILTPVDAAVWVIVTSIGIRGFFEIPRRRLLKHYWNSSLLAVLSSSPAMLSYLKYGQDIPLGSFICVALISPILWLFLVYAFRNPVATEISDIWSRVRSISRPRSPLNWGNRPQRRTIK